MINDQANFLLVRNYGIVSSPPIALQKDVSEAVGKEIMIHRMVKLNIPTLSL